MAARPLQGRLRCVNVYADEQRSGACNRRFMPVGLLSIKFVCNSKMAPLTSRKQVQHSGRAPPGTRGTRTVGNGGTTKRHNPATQLLCGTTRRRAVRYRRCRCAVLCRSAVPPRCTVVLYRSVVPPLQLRLSVPPLQLPLHHTPHTTLTPSLSRKHSSQSLNLIAGVVIQANRARVDTEPREGLKTSMRVTWPAASGLPNWSSQWRW